MSARNTFIYSTIVAAALSLAACGGGGGSDNPDSIVTPDTTPESFTFTAQTDVSEGVWIESNTITVSGINKATTISVTGGEYAIGSGNFTAMAGDIELNQTVRVRLQTPIQAGQSSSAMLSIGGVTATFTATTTADTTPDAFTFTALQDVAKNIWLESNSITVAGIISPANIEITGGEYSIDGGSYSSSSATVGVGEAVRVRVQSSNLGGEASTATLTIGGVSSAFTVTTAADAILGNPRVDVNFNRKHSVNGVAQFDRQKYITIHASHQENGWSENDSHSRNAPNAIDNLLTTFANGYDVYFGRETGSPGWQLRNVAQDTSRAGFIDEASATTRGNGVKWSYTNGTSDKVTQARAVEFRARDMIVGGQQHPYWPEGTLINTIGGTAWAFSQEDTVDEPLGTATGHFFSQFLSKYFALNDSDLGTPKPTYFEVMNEPLYDLTSVRSGADRVEPVDIFRFHNTVADEIRKTSANDNIAVGGYTVAFPNFEEDDFNRWNDRDKLFLDTAGDKMDFISIHTYDFPRFENSERFRKGSNLEATLDMLDHYSMLSFEEVKPLVVSEYGAQIHTLINQGWSEERNTHSLRSTNSQLMSFLERPDTIAKTIPFFVVKAEWGRKEVNGVTVPYGPRLMIQEFERTGDSSQTSWVYSDLVLFYDLWSDVAGTRIDTYATDQDLQVDAYIDGDTAYIILNSLEFDETDIDLNALGLDESTISSVTIRHLVSSNDANLASSIETTELTELPDTVTLDGEGTMIIEVVRNADYMIDQTLSESKHYADSYLQEIIANQAIDFSISDVTVGNHGEAVLRLGIGRAHDKSLQPTVTVNGNTVAVPTDFRGYDQVSGDINTGRASFYGTLEIPVSLSALQQNNTVSVTFPDAGGHVASVVMQVFNSTDAVIR
ncbi:cellulase family glycosylhydrolase [Echinimonas agarilytica]|uniref:Cellulase family glycosylhydrolase n=1 Tax=Echinimonas agarilytica TaxID=1215918 RepID=A0AA41W932_9GAMM|nr:cellulase family glycosylhydrolase [Echinimonas agarilytica]MCM2681349.1 cellulase family glycosylhydrolase [Echinimonas agarilytica]